MAVLPLPSRAPQQWQLAPDGLRLLSVSIVAASHSSPFMPSPHSQVPVLSWGLTSKAWALAPSPCLYQQISIWGYECRAGYEHRPVCVGLHFAFCKLVATLSSKAQKISLHSGRSPTSDGTSRVLKHFLFHSTFPEVQVPSRFISLSFFFLLLSYTVTWRFLDLLEVWGLLPAFSRCSVRTVPHVVVFLM